MGVLSRRRTTAAGRLAASSMALAALAGLACGRNADVERLLPGPGGRLDPIYDATVAYPSTTIVLGGLPYTGVEIDLAIEFSDATLRDGDPAYAATARVEGVRAGGIAQAFQVEGPLDLQGTLSDGTLATGLFGPIRVGTADLLLDLTGTLLDGARRVAGAARLYGSSEGGSFVAVKRRRYLVAGTDRQGPIGKVAVITVRYDTRITMDEDLEIISSDPVARVEDGRPLVINRYNYDNVQGLDPFSQFQTSFQDSLGDGANPHDAVILPAAPDAPPAPAGARGPAGMAFVTRYEPPYNDVAVLDLRDGSIVDRIDLTPFARNSDHLPRADQALLHDGLVYVTMEDANLSFTEFMNGRVVVIDPALRQPIDVIDLSGQNPFEALESSAATGLIYVGLAGIFPGRLAQALTGGIEVIDPATRRSRVLVDDDALGGNVSALALQSGDRGYCVVSDAAFHNYVKAFDPTTGEVLGTVFDSASEIATVAADGDGYLLIAEDDFFAPRTLILDAATGRPVASLPSRLPPFSYAILTRSL